MKKLAGFFACLLLVAALVSAPLVLAQEATTEAAPAVTPAVIDQPLNPSAAPAPSPAAVGSALPISGNWLDLAKGLGAFVLVLILLVAALKALGRLGRFKGRGARRGRDFFELRGIQALDNRKYLAAVEAEGRIIIVGVTPDRVTPVAQWIADAEEDDLDLSSARLPADEPGLVFKLPEEEDDQPPDISVADAQQPERSEK